MNQAELDAAIEQANRVFSRGHVRAPSIEYPTSVPVSTLGIPSSVAAEEGWPMQCKEAQQRFAQPHAKLFPLLGRKVRTPAGPGTLLQVFAERVMVLLDSELTKCSCFSPVQIEPVSGDWPR